MTDEERARQVASITVEREQFEREGRHDQADHCDEVLASLGGHGQRRATPTRMAGLATRLRRGSAGDVQERAADGPTEDAAEPAAPAPYPPHPDEVDHRTIIKPTTHTELRLPPEQAMAVLEMFDTHPAADRAIREKLVRSMMAAHAGRMYPDGGERVPISGLASNKPRPPRVPFLPLDDSRISDRTRDEWAKRANNYQKDWERQYGDR